MGADVAVRLPLKGHEVGEGPHRFEGIVKKRRALPGGLEGAEHRREVFVAGIDQRGGGLGGLFALGGDGGDGLSRVADLPDGEHGLILERGTEAGVHILHPADVLSRHHPDDAGGGRRRFGVDVENFRVGPVAPRKDEVERAGKFHVADVGDLAAYFLGSIEPGDVVPDHAPFDRFARVHSVIPPPPRAAPAG